LAWPNFLIKKMAKTIKVSDELHKQITSFDGSSMNDKLNKKLNPDKSRLPKVTESHHYLTETEIQQMIDKSIEDVKGGY